MELDGVADAFPGTRTIVHMKADAELDEEAFLAALRKAGGKKLKLKGKVAKSDALL
ncbi:MAG: hypothetical protein O2816_02710 [Planctomycetota bacterium]|nr:hypothetical protein [Planctomycetota bacterium]